MFDFGRRRREEETAPRPGAAPSHHYRMRERIMDIGDDYFIENASGTRVYKVNGKALRVRNTLDIEDLSGNVLVSIQERMLRVRDTMAVSQGGRQVAAVHKAIITPLRQHLSVEMMSAAPDMEAKGNLLDHEYEVYEVDKLVARVSKKWLRLVDTYDVDISPGRDDALVLAIVICIDQMAHD